MACDDGNPNSEYDQIQLNCSCQGVVFVSGCTSLFACNFNPLAVIEDLSCVYPGDPCDDGNSNTPIDIYDENCECIGLESVAGCTDSSACNWMETATENDGSCAYPGDPCNDGNSNTVNDTWNSNCWCQGTEESNDNCAIDSDGYASVSIGIYADDWPGECEFRVHALGNTSVTTDWYTAPNGNSINSTTVGLGPGDWTMEVYDSYGDGKGQSGYYFAQCLTPSGATLTLVNTPFTDGYSNTTNFSVGTGFAPPSISGAE